MRIEILESHYNALRELAKDIPLELVAKETKTKKGNERIVVECKHGQLLSGSIGGEHVVAIVRAANLMRQIYYHAEINRLHEEEDGYRDPFD